MRPGTCMRVYYYYYAYIHQLTLSNATARRPYCTVTRQVEDIAIEVAALAVGVEGSHRDISVRLLCWHKCRPFPSADVDIVIDVDVDVFAVLAITEEDTK